MAADDRTQDEILRDLLEHVVEGLGLEATVTVDVNEEAITGTLHGEDLGIFIGRHGQTIDAIQYLLNAVGWRTYGEERREVVVDAADYRARRQATLESLALRVADRVRESGEPEELEPMTAVERKVVHLRLKDVSGVGTTSEGTEPNRYVVVVPE